MMINRRLNKKRNFLHRFVPMLNQNDYMIDFYEDSLSFETYRLETINKIRNLPEAFRLDPDESRKMFDNRIDDNYEEDY